MSRPRKSRTSYKGGQDEDIPCYNCNKYGHCSRDCLLPNRTRKDQEPVLTEDEIKKICKKVITENMKPRENHLLHNVHSLQHKVNNLSIEKSNTPRENHLLHNVHSLQQRVNNLSIEKNEDVFCMLQGEAIKYFWTSFDRHRKFSTFCYSLRGVLGVHRGQA